jgi:hypothetical protein
MKSHAAEELETKALAFTPVFAALSVLLQTPVFAEGKHATEKLFLRRPSLRTV